MSLQKIFEEFNSYMEEAASDGFNYPLVRPARNIHGIPEMRSDREAGSVFYIRICDIDALIQITAERPDAEALVEKLEKERALAYGQWLDDFLGESKFHKLVFEDHKVAWDKIWEVIDGFSGPKYDEWAEYRDTMMSEDGLIQFETCVFRNIDNEPILYSHINFECPYYRDMASIAACCGPKAARDGLNVILFSEKLDQNDPEGSCRKILAQNFPAALDGFLPENSEGPGL